ncbi:MAG: helix-turn-helix transcriptional regulator [Ilumatobacteraceae bacterium]
MDGHSGLPSHLDPSGDSRDLGVSLLVRADEAAALLSVGRSTLYELVWSGRLHPVHIGRSVRFVRADLEAFVARLAAES